VRRRGTAGGGGGLCSGTSELEAYSPKCLEEARLLTKSVLGWLTVLDWAGNAPEWAFLMANREPESGTKELFNRLMTSRKFVSNMLNRGGA
jgi:hypothetical protein